FDGAAHAAARLVERLAVLFGDLPRDAIEMILEQLAEPEHRACPHHGWRLAPAGIGPGRRLHGGVEVGRGRQRRASDHRAPGRVVDVEKGRRRRGHPAPPDVVPERFDLHDWQELYAQLWYRPFSMAGVPVPAWPRRCGACAPHRSPAADESHAETVMRDLSVTFTGLTFKNPFLLSSAPPTESDSNIMRAFEAGWGGVVTKTIGLHPVVNVKGPKTKFLRTD